MKLGVLALGIVSIWSVSKWQRSGAMPAFPSPSDFVAAQEQHYQLVELDADHLVQLATSTRGATVIEVTMKSCAVCRKLEASFPAFREARPDITFVRIEHPQRIDSREKYEWVEELRSRYEICGTPHVVVVSAAGEILAEDKCKSATGRSFLETWMRSETQS